jgi:hypothetical protein
MKSREEMLEEFKRNKGAKVLKNVSLTDNKGSSLLKKKPAKTAQLQGQKTTQIGQKAGLTTRKGLGITRSSSVGNMGQVGRRKDATTAKDTPVLQTELEIDTSSLNIKFELESKQTQ